MKWEEEAVTLGKCYLSVAPAAEFTAFYLGKGGLTPKKGFMV